MPPASKTQSRSLEPAGERLQKVLAAAGKGSRRECEEMILAGRVEVDRKVVTELGTRVDTSEQVIRMDGERLLLNDDQLLYVEAPHDTMLVLTTGERIRVLETPEEIVDRVAQWRQRILGLSFMNELETVPG